MAVSGDHPRHPRAPSGAAFSGTEQPNLRDCDRAENKPSVECRTLNFAFSTSPFGPPPSLSPHTTRCIRAPSKPFNTPRKPLQETPFCCLDLTTPQSHPFHNNILDVVPLHKLDLNPQIHKRNETMDASSMERVDALWFPDGNIVLCAHGVLFRVFRGILAARSPVFADMLAFPQPEDAETLDGCPVLHLDDSAADAMYFLKALFDYE